MSALQAGLDTLPMAGVTVLASPFSGRLVGRIGARPSLVIGGLGLAAGSLLLADLSATTSFTRLFVAYVVFGVGFGFVNAPITVAAVSGMPASQAGVASAIASTSRQIGQTLGVAIVGATAAAGLESGHIVERFPAATHIGWWITCCCGLVVLALGIVTTTRWALRTADRTAARWLTGRTPYPRRALPPRLRCVVGPNTPRRCGGGGCQPQK